MNMPNDVINAIKGNNNDLDNVNSQSVEPKLNTTTSSVFNKISTSYEKLGAKIDDYNHEIKVLRVSADKLKEEIHRKKNIEKDVEFSDNGSQKKRLKEKIELNNYSINEETCNTAVDQINNIKSNISNNSKAAYEILQPLEETFDLLKLQVKYTMLLEDILELFNKKKEVENKLSESDQIITMLAESLSIKL